MALTAAEQAEMVSLQKDLSNPSPSSGLTDAEKNEMASLQNEVGEKPSRLSNIIRGQVDALPMYGSVAGGFIGGALATPADLVAGPAPTVMGAMAGAGLGAGLGKGLKNLINKHVYGEDPYKNSTMGDVAKDYAGEIALGAAGEGGGQVIGKGLSKVAEIAAPSIKSGADAVRNAASRLRVTPTAGMLTDSGAVQALESQLSKSPTTIGGYFAGKEQAPVVETINKTVNDALDGSTSLSPYESGGLIKKGLISDIAERHQPIQMAYQDAGAATKDIPINPQSQTRVARNIRNVQGANLLPELQSEANVYAQGLENSKSASDLKILKSRAKTTLADPTASYEKKKIAGEALDRLDKLETNTIMREAISQARTPGEGRAIGNDVVGNLKSAAKEYREMMGDVNTLARGSKLTSGKYGISNITKEIDQVPNEKMGDALFKTNDYDFLTFLKEKHPESFSQARAQKLSEIAQKSKGPDGTVSANKFYQSIKNYGPEVRKMLFGEKLNSLDDAKVILENLPKDVNPSGTSRGTLTNQTMNPIKQGMSALNYGLYKTLPQAGKIANSTAGKATGLILRESPKLGLIDNER